MPWQKRPTRSELERLYIRMTMQEIADQFGVSRESVRLLMAEYGILSRRIGRPPRYGPKPKPRVAVPVAVLMEEYLAGASTYRLAVKYGRSPQTISQRLRDAGCPMRPRGGKYEHWV